MSLQANIQKAENNLMRAKEELATLRRQIPAETVKDYELKRSDGSSVKLSELFGDKKDLILVQNMGAKCPYCTLWADGFNGIVDHLTDRAAFVVASHDEPKDQKAFAQTRGWRFPMASLRGTSFSEDMGLLMPEEWKQMGKYRAGAVTFSKASDGSIRRVQVTNFGPNDDFCSVFSFFNLLEEGVNGWQPQYKYQ